MSHPFDPDSPLDEGRLVDEVTGEVRAVRGALQRLSGDESALPELEEALGKADVEAFARVLEQHDLSGQSEIICRWVCSWRVQRVCFWLCRDLPLEEMTSDQVREAAIAFGKLAQTKGALERLVDASDGLDVDRFRELLKEFGLLAWCRLVCLWIVTIRCQLFCYRLSAGPGRQLPNGDPIVSLRTMAVAVGRLAEHGDEFTAVLDAYGKGDVAAVRDVLTRLDLIRYCRLFCWWLCVVVPYLRCVRICLPFGIKEFEPVSDPSDSGPVWDWARAVVRWAGNEDAVTRLLEAAVRGDTKAFTAAVKQFELSRWCPFLCFWLHRLLCLRFCTVLCPPPPPLPYFYKLGGYDYTSAVDSGTGGTGLTSDNRAFYATVRLNGSALQKQYNGGAPEYRFEVLLPGASTWAPVLPAQIAPTSIGSFTRVGLITPKQYVVNGTGGPNEITIPVAADGWIAVPTANNYWTAEGYFSSTGDYLNLITAALLPWPPLDVSTVNAGDGVPTAQQGADRVIGIRMRWRRIGDTGNGIDVGTAQSVAVCNDRWNQVQKYGSWVPTRVDGQLAVVSVNVDEIGSGCAEVTNQLHVRYTAAHPNLGPVSMTLTGPGGFSLTMTDDGGASATNRFGVAEVAAPSTAADLQRCTYVVTLSADVLLTTGDSVPLPVQDLVAFHKS
jgi:hypothetical protein